MMTSVCCVQGMKNFSPTAGNLLAAMTKIDNNYFPEVISVLFKASVVLGIIFHIISHCFVIFSFLVGMQTLHRMYIVNAGTGFKKFLWPAAQKFLDAKTVAKIQVQK